MNPEMSSDGIDVHAESCAPHSLKISSVLLCSKSSLEPSAVTRIAVQLCHACAARLTVLHTTQLQGSSGAPLGIAQELALQEDVTELLQKHVEELRESGLQVSLRLMSGPLDEVLLPEINQARADLIVLGTHVQPGFERWLWGSTAEAISRHAPCPVMIVGPQVLCSWNESSPGPIVFATGFHDGFEHAAQYAGDLADLLGTTLASIHVLPETLEGATNPVISLVVRSALQEALAQEKSDHPPATCETMFGADVVCTLIEYARSVKAQALVLGVQGGSWLTPHFPPQKLSRILMMAPCPVITICAEEWASSGCVNTENEGI